jgi:hypothetical protein
MQIYQPTDFQKEWLDFHRRVPGWLYHYTTVDGLLGIVRDRMIFGTHYQFLNDSLEIVWGKRCGDRLAAESNSIAGCGRPVRTAVVGPKTQHRPI